MGDIADMILEGILDEETGEYIDDELSLNGGPGYPRTQYKPRGNKKPKGEYRKTAYIHLTPSERKIASIRKEIALLCKGNVSIEEARRQINIKYGKGWRERGLVSNSNNQWTKEDLLPFN